MEYEKNTENDMQQYDIAIIGRDKRIAYMVPFFEENGYRVICYNIQSIEREPESGFVRADSMKQAITSANVIVGGIPFVKASEMKQYLKKGQIVFGGVIPVVYSKQWEKEGIKCFDFMDEETIAVFNAVATAEGAILEALQNQQTNIHRSYSLVLGYGRCGRVLADKLKGLSANVTVCSSNEQELAVAEAAGFNTLAFHNLDEEIHLYEYIFNTIPAIVLKRSLLEGVRYDAIIIDIASGTGGVDYIASDEMGIHAFHCLGLPGKYAAKISARNLADYVIRKVFSHSA